MMLMFAVEKLESSTRGHSPLIYQLNLNSS
jgi:hypothetical protein